MQNAHGMFVTGLEFLPVLGSELCSSSEASVLSISVDNKLCIHDIPYRSKFQFLFTILYYKYIYVKSMSENLETPIISNHITKYYRYDNAWSKTIKFFFLNPYFY